jgi:hypothetical protein
MEGEEYGQQGDYLALGLLGLQICGGRCMTILWLQQRRSRRSRER